MPVYQAWNPKSKHWVKYHWEKDTGFRPIDVKQRDPHIPFKGVIKRGKRR